MEPKSSLFQTLAPPTPTPRGATNVNYKNTFKLKRTIGRRQLFGLKCNQLSYNRGSLPPTTSRYSTVGTLPWAQNTFRSPRKCFNFFKNQKRNDYNPA